MGVQPDSVQHRHIQRDAQLKCGIPCIYGKTGVSVHQFAAHDGMCVDGATCPALPSRLLSCCFPTVGKQQDSTAGSRDGSAGQVQPLSAHCSVQLPRPSNSMLYTMRQPHTSWAPAVNLSSTVLVKPCITSPHMRLKKDITKHQPTTKP